MQKVMIISDSLVCLHLHKSGGTFLNALLMKCLRSARRVGYHLPYSEVPAAFRGLPVLGTVRNPWDYYVSWYHFQQGQENPNPLFRICSEDGALGFEGTVRNLVGLVDDDARIDRLAAIFPDHFVNHGLNLRRQCIESLRGSGKGFYTFLHDRLYAGAEAPQVLRMESLREQLYGLTLGGTIVEQARMKAFLDTTPRLNVSERGRYGDYYSPELRDLVACRDRPVIETYGYSFQDTDGK
ncbi:MAG: hypothetical protein QM647_13050 [Asticcacaulis sp.]|uniref:hypothetical protein n=1 Tax=Asticcacaulis sp. TaxID=1872648 RepID=UPI0039E4733A